MIVLVEILISKSEWVASEGCSRGQNGGSQKRQPSLGGSVASSPRGCTEVEQAKDMKVTMAVITPRSDGRRGPRRQCLQRREAPAWAFLSRRDGCIPAERALCSPRQGHQLLCAGSTQGTGLRLGVLLLMFVNRYR